MILMHSNAWEPLLDSNYHNLMHICQHMQQKFTELLYTRHELGASFRKEIETSQDHLRPFRYLGRGAVRVGKKTKWRIWEEKIEKATQQNQIWSLFHYGSYAGRVKIWGEKKSIEGGNNFHGTNEKTWQYDFIMGLPGKLLMSPPPSFVLKTTS